MRNQSEIDKQIQLLAISEKYAGNPATTLAVQALGWVLGEKMSPAEMLDEENEFNGSA